MTLVRRETRTDRFLPQEALQVTQQHQRLAALLRESVQKRLLHPGANTHQIIDVYIATIKVLRVLDPKVKKETPITSFTHHRPGDASGIVPNSH